jgi:hypothetical protein
LDAFYLAPLQHITLVSQRPLSYALFAFTSVFRMSCASSPPANGCRPFRVVEPVFSSAASIASTATSSGSLDDDFEAIDLAEIATMYPPNPNYNIAEKPWLPGPQTPFVLLNAKLVDPRAGKVNYGMTLHLAGGKVISVAPTTERDLVVDFYDGEKKAEKIDASKYFVCPGLIDCELFILFG